MLRSSTGGWVNTNINYYKYYSFKLSKDPSMTWKKIMISTRFKQFANLIIACLLILMTGCALSSYNTHPEYDQRIRAVKNPVLLMSDVHMYQMTSDGKNLHKAILQNLQSRQCDIKPLEPGNETSQEIEEVKTLYKLVHKTMDQQTFGSSRSISRKRGFRYSLGSLETVLEKLNADAATLTLLDTAVV